MRKLFILLAIVGFFATVSKAQLIDEKNVTITMDLQPVLQLKMTTPDHLDFVFDKISDYYAGIIKYGATTLKVSSTVSWDLFAVGTTTNGGVIWDQQVSYSNTGGANSINSLPISLLELHQNAANACAAADDYSHPFDMTAGGAGLRGNNSIYEFAGSPYTPPAASGAGNKYLQGDAGVDAGAGEGAVGGSYLTVPGTMAAFSPYYFVIDYRIKPGLPATFPNAWSPLNVTEDLNGGVPGVNYAQPGLYTMDVKYILCEDQ